LLLIGLVADADRLFSAVGHWLARRARSGVALYLGAVVLVVAVTSVLNLDTSVAFLTPVLIYATRGRDSGGAPLLYGCLLLSNASSLLLPGSNLTNLIVLGHLHLSGGRFAAHTGLASMASVTVTACVIAVAERRSLRARATRVVTVDRPVFGLGLASVVASVAVILVVQSPALPIAAIGVAAVGIRVVRGRQEPSRAREVLGLPVLAGLLGLAIALGTAGRAWSGPSLILTHLDSWGTAALAAVISVAVNNLPAASLLAARVPPHPFALLVGLDIGPNLFVTGSLSWILWIKAAKLAGARPSISHATRLGVVAAPLAIAAATGALALVGLG
jgi:arsenical pump membrane protein